MARIIEQPSTDWQHQVQCHICLTLTEYDQDDLQIGGFKADPNTYWFDGSARSVEKFYVECPHKCDITFVDRDKIPGMVQLYVLGKLKES